MSEKARLDPGEWVDRYGDDLYRYAMFRLRNPEVAEEVVQETLLAALKSHKSFSGRSSEKTWLIGILKHKIVDSVRKSSRDRSVASLDGEEGPLDGFFDGTGHWKTGPSDWSGNPGEMVENKEFREVLDACLRNLPERLSKVFALRELEAVDREDICKIMNVTATNLGVMLHRARARLRDCLEQKWFGRGRRAVS